MRFLRSLCSFAVLACLGASSAHAVELGKGIDGELFWIQDVLGKVAGSGRRGATYQGLVQAGVVLHLDKLLDWQGTRVAINGLYGYGPSLTGRYLHDFQYASNIEAYDTVRLNEVWLEKSWLEERFSLRAGLLVADTDFFILPAAEVFVNSGFATPPTFSSNFNAPTFPLTAPGVRVEGKLTENLIVRAAIYSGDIGTERTNDKHGAHVSFSSEDGVVLLAEVERRFSLLRTAEPALLKVSGYYATGKSSPLTPGGDAVRERGLWSVFAMWDQTLHRWSKDRHVHFFLRTSYAGPSDRLWLGWMSLAGWPPPG